MFCANLNGVSLYLQRRGKSKFAMIHYLCNVGYIFRARVFRQMTINTHYFFLSLFTLYICMAYHDYHYHCIISSQDVESPSFSSQFGPVLSVSSSRARKFVFRCSLAFLCQLFPRLFPSLSTCHPVYHVYYFLLSYFSFQCSLVYLPLRSIF